MESLKDVEPEGIDCMRDIINIHTEFSIIECGQYSNYWQLASYLFQNFRQLNFKAATLFGVLAV